MNVKEENSDNEFYDACDKIGVELSDEDDFVSIKPNYPSHLDQEFEQKEKTFVPLHEELNEKLKLEKQNVEVGRVDGKNDDDDDNVLSKQDDDPFFIDENILRQETLSEEQKKERLEQSLNEKKIGNDFYKEEKFLEALESYTKSLRVCPIDFSKDRSVLYSNRSICFLKLKDNERCIAECTKSLELDSNFIKPLLRRAECYQTIDKLEESLEDYKKLVELEQNNRSYKAKIIELEIKIKERNEKLKEEMMGKLKDLGNLVLKPFGLSTQNFQFVQDPNTGSYSVNFKK